MNFPFTCLGLALLLSGANSSAASDRNNQCHVLLASNQCVDLTGSWKYVPIREQANVLEIKDSDRRHVRFPFVVDATHGDSTTHIEGEFTLKQDIGLYTDEHPEKGVARCSLVFVPLSPRELKVIGFGTCEEGRGAVPDGIYVKAKTAKTN